ncbi:MAG: NAD(+) synthase [Clostridiales bacterium]|jgi:NAD+ synthase (glutamine-hydrolysing)|nr:NAD(+) synthase [Clostridiales bacterium]
MRDGFIKIGAASPQVGVAACSENKAYILDCIGQAAKRDVRVLVLPELCITGYTCGDLLLQDALIKAAADALIEIARQTAGLDMLVALGLPVAVGTGLLNCAAIVHNGDILGLVPKGHVPNYGEFYEKRHFTTWQGKTAPVDFCGRQVPLGEKQLFTCSGMPGLVIGAEICEDLWVPAPPSIAHAAAGASVVLNLSASNEVVGKAAYRRLLLKSHSARLCCAYAYADAGCGESTTDLVFGGHNIIAENGRILAETAPFETEPLAVTEVDVARIAYERRRMQMFTFKDEAYTRTAFSLAHRETRLTGRIEPYPFIPHNDDARYDDILNIQAHGLKKRWQHAKSKCVLVGVSGGLDSTLALLVADKAAKLLGRKPGDIMAVTMPCFGTTALTRDNALALCESMQVPCQTVDITLAVKRHLQDIGQPADVLDVTYENAQARERTQVLMDLANRYNGLVAGTGDLSELALGWATYNGDHMSMYAVNASIPKTLVRHMVAHIAATTENAALQNALLAILDTPISPELLPARDGKITQRTEDLIGPYALHDFFLYHMVRWGASPAKLLRLACLAFNGEYDKPTIKKWLRVFITRFFTQQFKRSCMPDGPKVGTVSLSPRGDWRMPSDAEFSAWEMPE